MVKSTIELWQPYYDEPLTDETAREILENAVGFFGSFFRIAVAGGGMGHLRRGRSTTLPEPNSLSAEALPNHGESVNDTLGKGTGSRNSPASGGSRSAVLYVRVSSKDREKEGYSIPSQEKLLREYAGEHGLRIVREFVDVETAKQAGRGGLRRDARLPQTR